MAFDALRSTLRRAPAVATDAAGFEGGAPIAADPTVDGGIDTVVFGCPGCGRTIARGSHRCDECGQRLFMDVPVGRASRLAGGGAVAGILATLLLVNLFAPPAPPVSADDALNGSAAGGNGAAVTLAVPAGAAAALRGTTALNGRLVAAAEPLAAALAAKSFDPGDVVNVLRGMSVDTRAGAGMVKALGTWPEAANQQATLAAFYAELASKLDRGLSASVHSGAAYRKSATTILETLGKIASLDAGARALAAQAGLDLPPVTIPAEAR